MKPKLLDGLVLAYGLLLIALGIYGYAKDQSLISLIAGGASGAIVLLFLVITAKNRQAGRIGVAVVSLLLLGRFGMSSMKALHAPPDGAAVWHVYTIAVASLIVFLALGFGHMSAVKARKLE